MANTDNKTHSNHFTANFSTQPSRDISTGALMHSHFNVRCPACAKLYRIDSREIHSSCPHFDCTACKTRFAFDFPPQQIHKIETRIISQKDVFQLDDSLDQQASKELKKCPKCQAMNPRLMKECIKCQVLFEKVEDLPLERKLGALPSLMKAWKDLMSDYENLRKHVAFVDRCEDLQALPFALKKYESLREAQPQDAITQQMFHRVLIRNLKRRAGELTWVQKTRTSIQLASAQINWVRVRKVAPFVISALMIAIGLSNPAARNLVGIGAAIIFLTAGITIFIKGRLSLSDFW
jgi:hypothetical protein